MARYTLGHHDSVLRSHRWRTAENSAGYLLPHLRSGMNVLDVGCGPGTITRDFARIVGPTGRVAGLDQSAEVLDEARGDAEAAGITNVDFLVGDIMALDVADGTYDVVHAHQVLQHLPDPVGALGHMRRITAPGGLVAARDADYAAMAWFPADPALDRWLEVYRAIARRNGTEPDGGRHLLSWALQAGLVGVEASASAWCYSTPAECRWWGDLQADRITGSAITGQIVEAGLADARELAEMGAAWRRWADAEGAWFGILHGEILFRVPRH
ncbi:MAG: class I SAM-dependent methyltransferase [Nitriliruptoraceae bacterium]